jgi:large subunit ribosomal protein L21
MFAVIKTGGKQYRVAAEDTITVAKLAGEPGEAVTFDQVLMLSNDNGVEVGASVVAGVSVAGTVVAQTRG